MKPSCRTVPRSTSTSRPRHQFYAAHDTQTRVDVLIKVISKPGLLLGEHGRLHDGRVYLAMSLFHEWPLATSVASERVPERQPAHHRTAIEVARALAELHRLKIWHVDLNPMNILGRWERGKPVIRIVDFESSYETARSGSASLPTPRSLRSSKRSC